MNVFYVCPIQQTDTFTAKPPNVQSEVTAYCSLLLVGYLIWGVSGKRWMSISLLHQSMDFLTLATLSPDQPGSSGLWLSYVGWDLRHSFYMRPFLALRSIISQLQQKPKVSRIILSQPLHFILECIILNMHFWRTFSTSLSLPDIIYISRVDHHCWTMINS